MVLESNSSALYKKQAFTIESLAKSSRDESPSDDVSPPRAEPVFRGINRSLEAIIFGILPQSSPTSPNLDRLTPVSDPGYKSLNSTPSKSEDAPSKRRRCSSGSDEPSRTAIPSSSPSDVSYDSISPYTSDTDACSDDQNRKKKARTAFSSDQVYGLEQRYQVQKYLPSSERSKLAKKLTLTDQQVKTWFQNRRMKEKRHQRDEEQTRNFYLPTGGVDIAQLHAMGLPCPPPYKVQSPTVGHMFPSPGNNALSGYQFHSPVHMAQPPNGQDRLQMHPGYLGYSPIIGSVPMFSEQSQVSRHAPSVPVPITSTPVSRTYLPETRGRSPA